MDEADSLEALANTLTLLTDNPYDISLHSQHVRLAREAGMEDQLEAAFDMITTFWAAGDYVWLPLLDLKIKTADLDTAEGLKSVLELFERAEGDYLCEYSEAYIERAMHRIAHYMPSSSYQYTTEALGAPFGTL